MIKVEVFVVFVNFCLAHLLAIDQHVCWFGCLAATQSRIKALIDSAACDAWGPDLKSSDQCMFHVACIACIACPMLLFSVPQDLVQTTHRLAEVHMRRIYIYIIYNIYTCNKWET